MRKCAFIFLLLTIAGAVFAQKPNPDFIDKIALQEKAEFYKKAAFVESQNYAKTDVVYQRMEWEINPNVLYIKGVVTTYFKSKTPDLNSIEFDLHSVMNVDSVIQKNKNVEFNRVKNKLIIQLAESLNEGQLDSVSVYYNGSPSKTGFGSFSKTTHDDVPNIWTLSEPYGAMEWWPCKQSLIDKIDSIDIIVTSPQIYRTASLGVLVSETVENNQRIMHWKHRYPVATYLVAISVTNYVDYSHYLDLADDRKIEILNYVYPENLEDTQSKTLVTVDLIELFNELIGEYPFANEKYGHAQFGWGGGMEHQTMSFMGNFGFELVSHELAHQWFGDYITTGSWQDIWLNEGFATYLAGLSYEHLLDGVWWPSWKNVNLDRIVSQPNGSVFVTDTTNIGAIFSGRLSYSKGAYLLHMLRWIMGDENFYRGIRNYYNDPEIANGFARTSQLVSHMENAADTTFTEFFEDWFYGEGFPIYSANISLIETAKLRIILSQTQSHNSVDFFEMPIPVRLYNSEKTDSVDYRLVHTQNNQEFIVDPGFRVSDLKIDPDLWLVSKTDKVSFVPIQESSKNILIFPNPFIHRISIFIADSSEIVSTQLFSTSGKLIRKISGNQNTFYWPNIAPGMYFIQVETTSGKYEQKLIKK